MAKNRLFISQDTMDQWVDGEKALIEADKLTLKEERGAIYRLVPAILFRKEATGADDPHDLIGRVKEEEKLVDLGADIYMDSVIVEDNAYDVKRGFVALPEGSTHPSDVPPPANDKETKAPKKKKKEKKPKDKSDEALAKLLLKHLK